MSGLTNNGRPIVKATANGKFIKFSSSADRLLQWMESGVTSDEIAKQLRETKGLEVSAEQIDAAQQRLVRQIEEIGETPIKHGGLWFRLPLLNPLIVERIATICLPLFKPKIAWFLFATLSILIGFIIHGLQSIPSQDKGIENWGYALLFYLLSVFIHEIGHASACAYFKAKPGSIGFGINYYRPVLYSDVSSAWTLKSKQRVIVDLGGMYFQLIIGTIYGVMWLCTLAEPLRLSLFLIAYSFLFSLNPIMKYDGYWIIADILDVYNLNSQRKRILQYLFKRLKGQKPKRLPWSSFKLMCIVSYFVAIYIIWALFIIYLAPYISNLLVTYPILAKEFLRSIRSPDIPFDFNQNGRFFFESILLLSLIRWFILLLGKIRKGIFMGLTRRK